MTDKTTPNIMDMPSEFVAVHMGLGKCNIKGGFAMNGEGDYCPVIVLTPAEGQPVLLFFHSPVAVLKMLEAFHAMSHAAVEYLSDDSKPH